MAVDKISFADWLAKQGSERLIWVLRLRYAGRLWLTCRFYFCSRVRKSGVDSQPFIPTCPDTGEFVNHFYDRADTKSQIVVSVVPRHALTSCASIMGEIREMFDCEKAIFASLLFMHRSLFAGFAKTHCLWPSFSITYCSSLILKDARHRGLPGLSAFVGQRSLRKPGTGLRDEG